MNSSTKAPSVPPADSCTHAKQMWNIAGTHGHCTECGKQFGEQASAVSPSEAIYAFAGWLTTRPGAIVMGDTHNAAAVADAVERFRLSQGWDEPRADYADRIRRYSHEPAVSPPALAKLRTDLLGLFGAKPNIRFAVVALSEVLALIDKHGGALEQQQGHQSAAPRAKISLIEPWRNQIADVLIAYASGGYDYTGNAVGDILEILTPKDETAEGHQSERSETAVRRPAIERQMSERERLDWLGANDDVDWQQPLRSSSASSACPVCGNAAPHHHTIEELNDLRRKAAFLESKLGLAETQRSSHADGSDEPEVLAEGHQSALAAYRREMKEEVIPAIEKRLKDARWRNAGSPEKREPPAPEPPNAPEAPIWLNNAEASQWQAGWDSGYRAGAVPAPAGLHKPKS